MQNSNPADIIHRLLNERDKIQKQAFEKIVEQYQKQAINSIQSIDKNEELTDLLAKYQSKIKQLECELQEARSSGSSVVKEELICATERLKFLNDERLELFKQQSVHSQKLLDLTEEIRTRESQIKQQKLDLDACNETIERLTITINKKAKDIDEKDVTVSVLQEEFTNLQLTYLDAEDELIRLRAENKELIERWLARVNEESRKMNLSNELSNTSPAEQVEFIDVRAEDLPENLSVKIPTRTKRKLPQCHDAEITCIQVSTEGRLIATGSNDQKLKLFDSKTGSLISTLSGCSQAVNAIDFSNHDDLVLAASNDNSTRVWTCNIGRIKHTLTGHMSKVMCAKFASESQKLLSGSHDRTIKIWDLNKGYCTGTLFCVSSCNDLAIIQDSSILFATGHVDNSIRVWDSRSRQAVQTLANAHSAQVTGLAVSPDKRHLLSLARDNTLRLVETRMFQTVKIFENEKYRIHVNTSRPCFSPDGLYASAGSVDGGIFFWNTVNGKLESILQEHTASVCGVQWSPAGGSLVYSADKDRNILFWE